jgi:DNA invertase Pin-like site-specific DNA recombinase
MDISSVPKNRTAKEKIMLKIGLTRPSARKKEPTPDEQARKLVACGVAVENIYGSDDELLDRVRSVEGPVEVVVTSLSGWGRNFTDLLVLLSTLVEHEGAITVLGPERLTLSKYQWYAVMANIVDLQLEDIAEKKRDAAAAARERKVPIGPTPKLSTRDVQWIWEQAESNGWGPNRLAKELKRERNISVSYKTVLRVLGRDKGRKPYVPRDNHKFLKRDSERRG